MKSPFYSAQPYIKKTKTKKMATNCRTGIFLVLSRSLYFLNVSDVFLYVPYVSPLLCIHQCFGSVFTGSGSRNLAEPGSNTDPDPDPGDEH